MQPIEFHILNEAGDVARLRYACQLVEQAYEQVQRCYVYADNEDLARRMDEMLWTFRDQAFIPHELHAGNSPSNDRIMALIGAAPQAATDFQTLVINVSDAPIAKPGEFTRVCEVVDADPGHKQLARERYKHYRELGCTLETKNQ